MHASSARMAALLSPLLAAAQVGDSADNLVRLFEAGRPDEVLARAPGVAPSLERDVVWVASMALQKGPDAANELSGKLAGPAQQRVWALFGASVRCMAVRRYDVARALFAAGGRNEPPASEGGERLQESVGLYMASVFAGIRRREDLGISPSDPRSPVIAYLGLNSGIRSDSSRIFAEEFGPPPPPPLPRSSNAWPGSAELGLKDFVVPAETMLDVVLSRTEFSISGDAGSAWRVRATHPAAPPTDFFVVQQAEETRLLALASLKGSPVLLRGLASRTRSLLKAGNIASARMLVAWAREALEHSPDAGWRDFLTHSTPEAVSTDQGVHDAASALAAATLTSTPMSFHEGMTRPVLRSSPNGKSAPNYPTDQQVFGLIIVKCILNEEGKAETCKIIKGLSPWIDQRMLDWLAGCAWSPVTFQGKPQRVSYVFNFRFSAAPHF